MNEEKTTLTECYVGFLDLMGVKKLVKAAEHDATLCSNVIAALQETKNISSFVGEKKNVETGETKRWSLQVQAFSDCVVLFIPTESMMLSWLLASIRRLHDRLIRLNVPPIRGSVTIGKMHWDVAWDIDSETRNGDPDESPLPPSTPVAFGPGLVAAYELENATAVYPRILISEILYSHIEEQRKKFRDKVFPLSHSGPLADFIRQDFDGLWHLDLLHVNINRRDVIRQVRDTDESGKDGIRNIFDETSYVEWLEIVRQFIENGIADVSGEKLESKYMWLAKYYNEKAIDQSCKLIRWFENLVPIPKRGIKLREKQKSNKKYERAKNSLPKEQKPVFDKFVEDFRLAGTKHNESRSVSYNILAEMVRAGWRLTVEPLKGHEGQTDGEE